jgi:hypothetical protein
MAITSQTLPIMSRSYDPGLPCKSNCLGGVELEHRRAHSVDADRGFAHFRSCLSSVLTLGDRAWLGTGRCWVASH